MNYTFRMLSKNDYEQYFQLINEFRSTNYTKEQFVHFLEEEVNKNKNINIWVIEVNNELIASGTILYETKLIHNISLYAHIEDIIVSSKYRKNGYGLILLNELVDVCKKNNSYKILLDCQEELIKFYEKSGFKKNGSQMVIYC
jgi:glucosamine-phosphate N-acetyltransferase